MGVWTVEPNAGVRKLEGEGKFSFPPNGDDEPKVYTITYTDDAGCTGSTSYTINAGSECQCQSEFTVSEPQALPSVCSYVINVTSYTCSNGSRVATMPTWVVPTSASSYVTVTATSPLEEPSSDIHPFDPEGLVPIGGGVGTITTDGVYGIKVSIDAERWVLPGNKTPDVQLTIKQGRAGEEKVVTVPGCCNVSTISVVPFIDLPGHVNYIHVTLQGKDKSGKPYDFNRRTLNGTVEFRCTIYMQCCPENHPEECYDITTPIIQDVILSYGNGTGGQHTDGITIDVAELTNICHGPIFSIKCANISRYGGTLEDECFRFLYSNDAIVRNNGAERQARC